MPLSKNPEFAGAATLPAGVMVPTLSLSVTGVQVVRLLGRAVPYLPRRAGGAADRLWLRALSAAFTHADTVYAFIGEAPGPGMEFVTTLDAARTTSLFPPISALGVATFTQAFQRSRGHPGYYESTFAKH
jgi:hypothetical protein